REDFDIHPFLIPELDAHLIVTVNGRFSDHLSQIGSLPKGVIVTGFAKAAAQHPELVDRYFNKTANVENESFTALNTAFVQDGVFVFVPKNTVVEKPLHIINVLTSHDDVFVQPRNLLVFEENSQAKLIESGHHREEARAFTNSVEEIFVARAANVDYYKIQDEGDTASQVNGTYVHQADSSVFSVNTITLSGAVVRNNLTVTLDGEHIESHLIGLVLPTGSQHIDVSTLIDHARPHCVSNELYKYVLDDAREGVFNGKVFVRQDAQQTNAFQENKSILLTETATMNAKPELEIYADDVKCSHGATTGQLDAEALFYLRSRGLPERLARGILLLAFARDILESVRIDALRTWLDQKMHERFAS
ncbi:MAG: Fe-S cluster assembly protein SufD, partial [Bacteroidota bacterium]